MGKCLFLRKGETHTAPISGILASDLAVGSSVYLMENGSAVEYLVVHQGLPSSMYDVSCDGTWLLRKDCYSNRVFGYNNDYANSDIHTWLNGTFLGLLDADVQTATKQVKIPYVNGTGGSAVASGASGLSVKVFLIGLYELGWVQSDISYAPIDGAALSYFSRLGITDNKRIAYLDGAAVYWRSRSADTRGEYTALGVNKNGGESGLNVTNSYGIRPALILPSNALFDKTTLILKGVA